MVAVLRKVYGGFMVPAKFARHTRGYQWWKGESAYKSMESKLAIKNSHIYCKNLLVIKTKYYAHAPRGIDW